jgi:hypothetical protein
VIEEIASVYSFTFADLKRMTISRLRFFCITARARKAARDQHEMALLMVLGRGGLGS